jgi:Domain of unknown function (DUF4476)
MKRFFTLLASLILSISLFASGGRPKSILTVKSLDKGDIRVVLDGRRFEPGVSTLVISGVDPGYHTIKVFREKNNGFINIFGSRYEMVYNTSLMVRPRTSMNITIDCFGRTTIDESRIRGNDNAWGRDDDWDHHGRDRDYDRDRNYDTRDGDYDRNGDYDYNHDRNYDSRDGDYDRNGNHDYGRNSKMGDYNTNYGYGKSMSDREFNQVLQSISTEWLESNKLKSATQIVTANGVTTSQVKQLMQLFSFESNKLELAKKAYPNTVDKNNFFSVNDEFSFNGSKDDLARFIRSFR